LYRCRVRLRLPSQFKKDQKSNKEDARMIGIRTFVGIASSTVALSASVANAQLSSFTITDGTVSFTLDGLMTTGGTGTSAGIASLRTGVGTVPIDHTFQNWFWFRNPGDTRERALHTQVSASAGGGPGNSGRLVYQEDADNGAMNNALRVELEYTINDLSNGGEPHALLVIAFKIQNLTNLNLLTNFFNYNDFDLNGTSLNDVGVVVGADQQTQLVTKTITRAAYTCSAVNHSNYEMAAFPVVRNKLTDTDTDNLVNNSPAFGPGDYSGGNQWIVSLAPAGSFNDCLVGSVAITITRDTCPGDTDSDGDVDVDDLIGVILGWGACP
jgi:hypothetical protein